MRRALALAARARGDTSPNPVVGCVVLDAAGQRRGRGLPRLAGGPHAEVVALREAGERARGGTARRHPRTLRPPGRTGPCTRAVIDAGVARVVVRGRRPQPGAPRGGAAPAARDAGVDVEGGLLADEAERVNAEWLTSRALRPAPT